MADYSNFIDYFKQAEKPAAEFKIGLEYEILGFEAQSHQRLNYQNVHQLLSWFVQSHSWQPIYEDQYLVGAELNGAHISLEPSGQLEISTKPSVDLNSQQQSLEFFIEQLRYFAKKNQWVFYQLGYDPFSSLENIPWMPKKRYQIMREYLHPLGKHVWHMMQSSCSFQVSLDFSSMQDMQRKFKLSNQISPIINSLFAASPFIKKQPTQWQSFRNHVWNFIDPDRTKILPNTLKDDFGYQDYIDYIIKVPMFLIERDQQLVDMRGHSFTQFVEHGFDSYVFEKQDVKTQLGVAFLPVRLRNTLEIRGADASNLGLCLSLAAFWKGLLYDPQSLQQGLDLVQDINIQELNQWFLQTPETGLQTEISGRHCGDLAEKLFNLAKAGLNRLAPAETPFLNSLEQIIEHQQPLSVQWVKAFEDKGFNQTIQTLKLL